MNTLYRKILTGLTPSLRASLSASVPVMLAAILTAILTAACGEAPLPDIPGQGTPAPDGTPITITAGAAFPEMDFGTEGRPGVRAMGEQPTTEELLNQLRVNLFVFDPSGVMLQYISPEDISIIDIDTESRHVYFKVTRIYSSSAPRRLHFVITSAADLRDLPGGQYITAMAGETTVMPALTVSGGTDAYWGLKEVDAIADDMQLSVKLIRNFARLTVGSTADESVFRLTGYTVVNRPGLGTVAPYIHTDRLFASFLDADDALLGYDEIIRQGYCGVNPAGSDAAMTHTTETEVMQALLESEQSLAAGATDTPCYIYERSQSGIPSAGSDAMATYIIIAGEYRGERCYYKIDIGRDSDGKFRFYDLLRNFQYRIEITEVGGVGAPTLADAMHGAAHNNLSASVVTRDLFAIGYEGEKIEVSATRVIFTERTDGYSLRFRYTAAEGSAFDPSRLRLYDLSDEAAEYDMSGATAAAGKPVGLEGEVLRSAEIRAEGDGWYRLVVATKAVPADSRRLEQNIRIYYSGGGAGLGRTVTFMLRRPWEFADVAATAPSGAIGDEFGVEVALPAGLAEAQFPLTVTFESDKQNICSLPGTALTVATGRSGFAGATTDEVIYYQWRVEWSEYAASAEGLRLVARFGMTTASGEDRVYDTSGVDAAGIAGRAPNAGSSRFCVRVANYGQKYIEPYYVDVERD